MSRSSHASHPWHDLSPGADLPEIINAVIEIPVRACCTPDLWCVVDHPLLIVLDLTQKGSKVKYELDKDTGDNNAASCPTRPVA